METLCSGKTMVLNHFLSYGMQGWKIFAKGKTVVTKIVLKPLILKI